MLTNDTIESLDDFIAKQQAALEKKKRELAELAQLGPVPGLSPWLVYSTLYGYRQIGFKLNDISAFLAWATEHALPIHAIEGRYKTMRPEIPDTPDYAGSKIVASGNVAVSYSTIMNRLRAMVFVRGYEISFDIPHANTFRLAPRAQYSGERVISWRKPGPGFTQYLRMGVDRQSADLDTLLTWEQFASLFSAPAVET